MNVSQYRKKNFQKHHAPYQILDSTKQYFVQSDWYKDMAWCVHKGSRVLTGDFNGDGRADMMCHDDKGAKWVALANAAGHFTGTSWHRDMSWCWGSTVELHLGDFNGDGRTDMLCHQHRTGLKWVSLANVDGSFTGDSWHDENFKWCGHSEGRLLVGDFNGDGRSDIFCYDSKNKWVALAQPGGGFKDTSWHLASGWCSHAGSSIYVADVNGDLLDDFHCHDNSGGNWVMLAGAGGKFTGHTDWHSSSKWCSDEFHLAYLNGDKRADMLCHRKKDGFKWVAAAGHKGRLPTFSHFLLLVNSLYVVIKVHISTNFKMTFFPFQLRVFMREPLGRRPWPGVALLEHS